MATFLPDFGTYYEQLLKIDNVPKDLDALPSKQTYVLLYTIL